MGMQENTILSKTVRWMESEKLIRVALLTGSFADRSVTDELSDYDISLFCTNPQQLIKDDSWLSGIDDVWVVIPEKYSLLGASIPTRLVIFQGGKKIDFSFFTLEQLKTLEIEGLPDAFSMGYKVLIDKDGQASKLPNPRFKGFLTAVPSEEKFHNIIKEFWFEVHHVAKYLYRKDLWSVQFRLSGIYHNSLIQMICWSEAAKNNWEYTTHPNGKSLESWVSNDTLNSVYQIFPHFDVEEGWTALEEMMRLFKSLSDETSLSLGYHSLKDLEREMHQFIAKLELRSKPRHT